MKRELKIINSNGFTLMEVIVGVGILGFLLMATLQTLGVQRQAIKYNQASFMMDLVTQNVQVLMMNNTICENAVKDQVVGNSIKNGNILRGFRDDNPPGGGGPQDLYYRVNALIPYTADQREGRSLSITEINILDNPPGAPTNPAASWYDPSVDSPDLKALFLQIRFRQTNIEGADRETVRYVGFVGVMDGVQIKRCYTPSDDFQLSSCHLFGGTVVKDGKTFQCHNIQPKSGVNNPVASNHSLASPGHLDIGTGRTHAINSDAAKGRIDALNAQGSGVGTSTVTTALSVCGKSGTPGEVCLKPNAAERADGSLRFASDISPVNTVMNLHGNETSGFDRINVDNQMNIDSISQFDETNNNMPPYSLGFKRVATKGWARDIFYGSMSSTDIQNLYNGVLDYIGINNNNRAKAILKTFCEDRIFIRLWDGNEYGASGNRGPINGQLAGGRWNVGGNFCEIGLPIRPTVQDRGPFNCPPRQHLTGFSGSPDANPLGSSFTCGFVE